MTELCYLCGREITADGTDDHVPPRQFFAESIRARANLSRLITLRAHRVCNTAFGRDEEYVTWTLSSIAMASPTGRAVVEANARAFQARKSVGLGLKTLREFEDVPSEPRLPDPLILKRVEGARVRRVIWKVVRGLYFHETSMVLPEATWRKTEIIEPVRASVRENPVWEAVKAQPGKGVYPDVFDYKYLEVVAKHGRLHLWGLLLWGQIMVFVAHRHPTAAHATPS